MLAAKRIVEPGFHYDLTFAEYVDIAGVNHSTLKGLARSPLHFAYERDHSRESSALTIGRVTHTAVLEPHRFLAEYALWDQQTKGGRTRPRNGKDWEAFRVANASKTIITRNDYTRALSISKAVRNDRAVMWYLHSGRSEVSMVWDIDGTPFKGRVDWVPGMPNTLVGLKTTVNAEQVAFGNQAARLGYVAGWAVYADGYEVLTGHAPRMIEIAVESTPPYDVAVYEIPADVLDVGRGEYRRHLALYLECMESNEWPGVAGGREQILSLPAWAFGQPDNDLEGLGLTGFDEEESE